MKTNYDKVRDWRHATKIRMVESFGGKCGICNYNKSLRALEFHHVNPEEKEFSFNSKCRSWKKIVSELKKCVMVCSNCHAEIHDNITEIPDDIQRFDESYINYKPKAIFDECPICGELKISSLITCSHKCAGKYKSKVDWDKYDLIKLYEKIGSYIGVARYIGNVSDVTIKKRIKRILT